VVDYKSSRRKADRRGPKTIEMKILKNVFGTKIHPQHIIVYTIRLDSDGKN
jgi:hypothetical protein